MSDINSQIAQLLSNPQIMEQLKSLSGMLGQQNGESGVQQTVPQNNSPPVPQGNPMTPQNVQRTPDALSPSALGLSGDSVQMAMKLAPMLSQIRSEDDTTRLLRALKPFLNPERQSKMDEAIRIIQLLRVVPLLRGAG